MLCYLRSTLKAEIPSVDNDLIDFVASLLRLRFKTRVDKLGRV